MVLFILSLSCLTQLYKRVYYNSIRAIRVSCLLIKKIERSKLCHRLLYLSFLPLLLLLLLFFIICNVIPQRFPVESSACITGSVRNVSLNIIIVTRFLDIWASWSASDFSLVSKVFLERILLKSLSKRTFYSFLS